jgi:hypothetical protein
MLLTQYNCHVYITDHYPRLVNDTSTIKCGGVKQVTQMYVDYCISLSSKYT